MTLDSKRHTGQANGHSPAKTAAGQKAVSMPSINRIRHTSGSESTPAVSKDKPTHNTRSHELNTLIGGTVRLEPKKQHMVKSLALLSNKGGVGKTHIAANMAYYMNRLKKQVLLLDIDLSNADITNKLGFYCENTIHDLLTGKRKPNEIIYTTPYGFHLIGGESGNLRLANLLARQKSRMIRLLREIEPDYDFVIYDLNAGIGSTTLDFALAQDYQIIITTPQDIVAGYSCIKAAYMRFQEVETSLAKRDPNYLPRTCFRPFLIINQVPTFATGKKLYEKIVTVSKQNMSGSGKFSVDIKLLGVVASDPARIREAELYHFLYSGKYGDTGTGHCFHFLAHNLIQYRDPNSAEFSARLKRFATLFVKSEEETK